MTKPIIPVKYAINSIVATLFTELKIFLFLGLS